MKFSIRDFAPIKEADIKLDGLTVIAGDNDTGKSTVGKLLYALVKAFRRSRRSGEKEPYTYYLLPLLQQVFGRDSRSGKLSLQPMQSIDEKGAWTVELGQYGKGNRQLFGSHDSTPDELICDCKDVLLVESPLIWQLFDTFQSIAAEKSQAIDLEEDFRISYPFTFFDAYARLNGSVAKSVEIPRQLLDKIKKTVDGQIVFESNSPLFQRGDEKYRLQNVATGIQAFGFIQRILELGIAAPGQLLILDEPEVHLHPKWQLEYARLLVDMVDQLGLTVLLTTHSPVFVEAIDFIGRNKLGDKCSVYLSERCESDDVVMKEVTDDLDKVYDALSEPLLRLSLLQGDA